MSSVAGRERGKGCARQYSPSWPALLLDFRETPDSIQKSAKYLMQNSHYWQGKRKSTP